MRSRPFSQRCICRHAQGATLRLAVPPQQEESRCGDIPRCGSALLPFLSECAFHIIRPPTQTALMLIAISDVRGEGMMLALPGAVRQRIAGGKSKENKEALRPRPVSIEILPCPEARQNMLRRATERRRPGRRIPVEQAVLLKSSSPRSGRPENSTFRAKSVKRSARCYHSVLQNECHACMKAMLIRPVSATLQTRTHPHKTMPAVWHSV